MNELKIILGNYMIGFLTAMAILYFINSVVTRIKNKQKMKRNQQVIRLGLKILKSVY